MSHSIYFNFMINSDKNSVYRAVSEPEHLVNWWPLKCSGTPKEGEKYNFNFTDQYDWYAEVKSVEQNEHIHFKMTKSDKDWDPTTFGFDLEEKDKGIYHAWNKALARTSGKWVCFLGGDDQWAYSDAIADMVEAGDKEGVNFVSGKLAYIDDRGQVTSEYGKPWSWSDIKSSHCIAHPGAFFHQSCFDANGRFDESYKIAGDYDFSLRLGRFVKPVFINKILVYMGDAGASRSRIFTVLKESWRAKATHPEVGRLLASITSLRTVLIIIGKKLRGRF